MTHRPLVASTLLALSAPAHALGVGTTAPVGNGLEQLARTFADLDGDGFVYPGHFYPSFDLRFDEIVIQIHALETITAIANDEVLYLGANGWIPLTSGTLGGQWEAFAGVGGSLDFAIDSGDSYIQVGPVAPIGIRFGTVPRVAVYVQPGLYLVSDVGIVEVGADASLLASVWF